LGFYVALTKRQNVREFSFAFLVFLGNLQGLMYGLMGFCINPHSVLPGPGPLGYRVGYPWGAPLGIPGVSPGQVRGIQRGTLEQCRGGSMKKQNPGLSGCLGGVC
jgi:hypothetical protein